MKHEEHKNTRKKKFIRMPIYKGGNEALRKFISENLSYPAPALENKVEGTVFMEYTVDNMGTVVDVNVVKGLGYGLDEEAIRVIRLLEYEPARNRGIRMKAMMKTRINFRLPKPEQEIQSSQISIKYVPVVKEKKEKPADKPTVIYNYTINLGK